MKPWDYYTYTLPKGEEYPSFSDIRKKLLQEIDETPLTKAQREERGKLAVAKAREIYDAAMHPIREKIKALEDEFWKDCREDLGYVELLGLQGAVSLENHAWQNGHSGGLGDVYSVLDELVDLFVGIKKTQFDLEKSIRDCMKSAGLGSPTTAIHDLGPIMLNEITILRMTLGKNK